MLDVGRRSLFGLYLVSIQLFRLYPVAFLRSMLLMLRSLQSTENQNKQTKWKRKRMMVNETKCDLMKSTENETLHENSIELNYWNVSSRLTNTHTHAHATTTKTIPNKVEFVSIQISWNCLLFVRMCDTIENDFFLFKFNFFFHKAQNVSGIESKMKEISSLFFFFFVWNPRQMSHKLLFCFLVEMHQFVLQ